MGVYNANTAPFRQSRAPSAQLVRQYLYQESDTAFSQHNVWVVGAGFSTFFNLPFTVQNIPGTINRYRRGGTERDESISGSPTSHYYNSDNKDNSKGSMSGTNARYENVDGEINYYFYSYCYEESR